MKLSRISADQVSRRPDQTAEWLNRLAKQVDIIEETAGSGGGKIDNLPIATTHSLGVVKVGQNLSITPEGVLSATAPTSFDYNSLFNKPKVNSVELTGDKSLSDLGINIPTSYWGQTAVGGVVGGTLTLTDGGQSATISTTGHNTSLAGIRVGNTSNYIEAGVSSTSVVSNTGNVNIKPKSGSSVDVFNAKVINVAAPTNNNDAANKYYVDTGLSSKQDTLIAGSNINIAADGKTISATVPTVGDATLTIQKNGTDVGTFTANATSNKTINITVPTTAADVGALPDSTKYAANLSLTIDSSTFVITGQLKDQDGNNIGNSQTIDLPLESVVVNGSYDSATKEVVLTLENGNTIRFSVADLVSGLQTEITSNNPLNADLVDDSTSTNKFVTSSDITTWNGKQNALTAGSNIQINGSTISATDTTYSAFTGASSGTAGTSGLVPAPAAGDDTKYLSGDGLWKTVSQYSLPIASTSTLGGIKVGNNLTIDAGTGVLDATDTTYTAGTNIDITSNAISTQTRGIEYIVGTQGSSTNVWTGTSTDKGCSGGTLYTGKAIVYRLPYAGTSSAATLNLTLPDGTTTGAKGVKYNTGGNVTTTYGAGCDIFMVYDGTNWKTSAWYDSNNYDRIRYYNDVKAAAAISGSRICVGTDAGYIMAAANATFDINYPLLWAGSAVNSGATNQNFYGAYPGVNLTNNKNGWSGTTNKMVFLVGTLSGTTFTIGSDVFTQTVPNSEDGKVYAPIGIAYSTTNILFYPNNTYWAYKNGEFRPISRPEPVMTGASSGTAGAAGLVPAPAAGDDTKFLSGDGTWKTAGSSSASQSMIIAQGSTQPVFDDMTPIKTFTWAVADTTYRPIYQMENTGWTYDNMDITVAYRITVTGTGISQITDVVDRWFSPTSWPATSVMCRTLSTSAATTGYRYLRAIYPYSGGLNNNTYKIGQEISNYNATSRTIKVEVFKTATGVTWNETKPAGPIYTSSTYQATNSMQPYSTRGWMFRAPASLNATSADAATRVSSYESTTIASSAIKSGEALTANYLAYQADDGKVYMLSNTAKNMACDENARIGVITTAYNNNTAIDTKHFRSVANLNSTQVGYISHGTLALGDRVYLRCTMDSSGNIHSGNYLATSMSAGYTWLPFGTATASNTIYMDVRKPTFYTLNSSGKLTHINGKKTTPDITITSVDPGEGSSLGADEYVAVTGTPDYSEMIDIFYPVGSYYETSDTSFDPNVTWAGTTWQEDTAGRILVAVGSGTFSTVGGTGGSETSTHRHWQTGGADSDHYYDLSSSGVSSEGLGSRVVTKNRVSISTSNATSGAMRQSSTYDADSSTVQPYIVVKRWHRIA